MCTRRPAGVAAAALRTTSPCKGSIAATFTPITGASGSGFVPTRAVRTTKAGASTHIMQSPDGMCGKIRIVLGMDTLAAKTATALRATPGATLPCGFAEPVGLTDLLQRSLNAIVRSLDSPTRCGQTLPKAKACRASPRHAGHVPATLYGWHAGPIHPLARSAR